MIIFFTLLMVTKCDLVDLDYRESTTREIVETWDNLETTGTFIRKLGSFRIQLGSYKVISPVNLGLFRETLRKIRLDTQEFAKSYKLTVHDRDWPRHLQLFSRKDEIFQMVVHTVDEIREATERVEERFDTLAANFQKNNHRQTRGLFNGVGVGLEWLFGVASTESLEKTRVESIETHKEIVKVMHANAELVTLMKQQHAQLDTVVRHQNTLQNATQKLIMQIQFQAFVNNKTRAQNLQNFMIQKLFHFHSQSLIAVNALADEVTLYFSELQSVLRGQVSPTLIDSEVFQKTLNQIHNQLPPHLDILRPHNNEQVHSFFSILDPNLLTLESGQHVIVLHIPLIRRHDAHSLYLVSVMPLPLLDTINSTARLNLRHNTFYTSHRHKSALGYRLPARTLENCQNWERLTFCSPLTLTPIDKNEIDCLNSIIQAKNLTNCEKLVALENNRSMLTHLRDDVWGFSVRGEMELTQNCYDGNEKIIVLKGVGRVKLQGGCSFFIQNRTFDTPITFSAQIKITADPGESIPQGFLATSVVWEEIRNSSLQIPGLNELTDLKRKLANEATFFINGTSLKSKTLELLQLTSELIKKGELKAAETPWFPIPARHDTILYACTIFLLCLHAVTFAYLCRARPSREETVRDLLKAIRESP